MTFPYLFRKEIEDEFAQENFKRLGDFFTDDPILRSNFKFITVTLASAVTDFKYPHLLNFTPMDVILLHNLANATVTFNYSKFDSTNINFTTSAGTTLRLLVGRYT